MLPHSCLFFFFNDTATTEIYTLSLHDALPILDQHLRRVARRRRAPQLQRRALRHRDPQVQLRQPRVAGQDADHRERLAVDEDGGLVLEAGDAELGSRRLPQHRNLLRGVLMELVEQDTGLEAGAASDAGTAAAGGVPPAPGSCPDP